uniref:Uncharacterized protein n=1 Tax=Romanomermis culicivorax TaxID=13658 RepID=A0A915KEU9_ROMCU
MTMKNVNQGNVPKNFHPIPGHKALATNLKPERLTPTTLTNLQAVTAPASRNGQAFGLVKRAFDKQSLQLPICGKIKVADGAVVNPHGPVVVTMESVFGEHMTNQPEEIEAKQPVPQAQPSPHQPPTQRLEVATAAADGDLTDHELAALDKSLPCYTDQQKLDFALNKMTAKTYVTAAQKSKALCMLRQNRNVFSLPSNKPTFTKELTVSIDTGSAKPLYFPAALKNIFFNMTTPSTSSASAANEPPPYRESINVNERYVRWAEQQPHQNDLSFCCDENNVKRMICAANLECWYVSLFARPPNVLPPLIFLSPGNLGVVLAAQPTPKFRGYTLVGFDTEAIMAADMKNFQFAMPMPAYSTASSYPRHVQLAFPNGRMFILETFTATLEDWTVFSPWSMVNTPSSFHSMEPTNGREYTLF